MRQILTTWALIALLFPPAANALEYRTVVPGQSTISFAFRQMGVPMTGGFKRFTARVAFDPARPEQSSARVEIDLASIDAGSPEADDEAAGKLWFNRSVYPKAVFVSSGIRALGSNRYEMRGTLTLKGVSRELNVPLIFVPGKDAARFDGTFTLRRLDFGIGEGMWADVSTVANDVQVKFSITASGK